MGRTGALQLEALTGFHHACATQSYNITTSVFIRSRQLPSSAVIGICDDADSELKRQLRELVAIDLQYQDIKGKKSKSLVVRADKYRR